MVHALDADKDHRQTCRARTRVFKEENITPKLGFKNPRVFKEENITPKLPRHRPPSLQS
jgi:hypothetical protein